MTVSAKSLARLSSRARKLNLAHDVLEASIARGCGSAAGARRRLRSRHLRNIEKQVNAVAAGLLDLDLKRGDLVLIKMSNSPEFAAAFLAAVKLGMIPVLVNSLLTAVELTRYWSKPDRS